MMTDFVEEWRENGTLESKREICFKDEEIIDQLRGHREFVIGFNNTEVICIGLDKFW